MTPEEIRAQFEASVQEWNDKLAAATTLVEELRTAREGDATAITELRATLDEQKTALAAAETRADALEASITREVPDADVVEHRTLGQAVLESEEFKRQAETNSWGGRPIQIDDVSIGSRWALTNASISGATALAQPLRIAGILALPDRFPRLRDLMQVIPLSNTGSVEYVRTTNFFNFAAEIDVDAVATDTSVHVSNINGHFVGQIIDVEVDGGTTETNKAVTAVTPDTTTTKDGGVVAFTGHALVGNITATNNLRVTSDHFAGTAEGNLKPAQDVDLELDSCDTVTIAHNLAASRQILEDNPRLQSFLDTEMIEGLGDVEDFQILYGAGTSTQMQGIISHPQVQTYLWSTGTSGDKKYDAFRRAMTLVWLTRFRPDGIVAHPSDWEDVELSKGTDGHYLNINIRDAGGNPMAWSLPVLITDQINVNEALVGAFRRGTRLYERTGAAVRIFDQHKDFAALNMVLLQAEQRECQTIERPEAFVAITFDAAP